MTDEELTALDKAVARAVGLPEEECDDPPLHLKFQPTRNPADWGPLIERFTLDVEHIGGSIWVWCVSFDDIDCERYHITADTPAIAICRAVVAIGEAREGAA